MTNGNHMTLEEMLGDAGLNSNPPFDSAINLLGGRYAKWNNILANFDAVKNSRDARRQLSREYHQEIGRPESEDHTNTFDALASDEIADIVGDMKNTYTGIMTDYSRSKFPQVIENSTPALLYHEALSMKPYKTGNANHDSIVSAHNGLSEISNLFNPQTEETLNLSEEQKKQYAFNKMREYVLAHNMAKKVFLPTFLKAALNNPSYLATFFGNVAKSREAELAEKFKTNDQLDKSKLSNYINNNLSKATEQEKNSFYFNSAVNLYPMKKTNAIAYV